jgi:hypothetical protein
VRPTVNIADILARHTDGPAITTNFDRVLETAFSDAENAFAYALWGRRPALADLTLRGRGRVLVKLHGDAQEAETRVFTRGDYQRTYGPHRERSSARYPMRELIAAIASARPLLFVGCSLQNDRYLRYLGAAPRLPTGTHFALVPDPGSARGRVARARQLAKWNIGPIWFDDGRYETIPPFLQRAFERAPRRRQSRPSAVMLGVSSATIRKARVATQAAATRAVARSNELTISSSV